MRSICVFTITILVGMSATAYAADAPKRELLWPNGAPGAKGDKDADKPTLTICLPKPELANGAAVVICPGGGYVGLAVDHEGRQVAEWLNSFGVAGFILEYRHHGRGYQHPAPLQDAQRAIRTVRARADEFKIDPKRIGILGFSAGGHLASTAGTHFDRGDPSAADPIDRVSSRPDFMVLCYAVIAFDEPYTHRGSQNNLLGKNPPPELVRSLSNEKQVTKDTPPTFLFTTDEDRGVPAENSVYFYLALRKAGVPAELHIFRPGRHGLGLAPQTPGTSEWPKCCENWLRSQGFLKAK
jgi:acetyl esterase/lipase